MSGCVLEPAIDVWLSRWISEGRFHLAQDCDGLVDTTDIKHMTYQDIWELCEGPRRVCRMCSLETVLYEVLCDNNSERDVLVTMTASAVGRFDSAGAPADWSIVTFGARERLMRVAGATGMLTAHTQLGPVAYGLVTPRAARALARLMRSGVLARGDLCSLEDVDPLAIEAFWVLDDELVGQPMESSELWDVVKVMTTP